MSFVYESKTEFTGTFFEINYRYSILIPDFVFAVTVLVIGKMAISF